MTKQPRYTCFAAKGGGEAIVYFAKDKDKKGREVAIRLLSLSFTDGFAAKRAVRELTILKHCKHDNIIELLDYFVAIENEKRMIAVVMPKQLHTLQYFIENANDWHLAYVQHIIYCTLRGTEYLHARDIIHRDLSMNNVMADGTGFAKIIDFGISREPSQNDDLTEEQAAPGFRAPEIFLTDYDKKVDLWSIGCILIQLVTGQPYLQPTFPTSDSHTSYISALLPYYKNYPPFVRFYTIFCEDKQDLLPKLETTPATTIRQKYPLAEWRPDVINHDEYEVATHEAKREDAIALMEQLVQYFPQERPTASEALQSNFFKLYNHVTPPSSGNIKDIPECEDVFDKLDRIGKSGHLNDYINLLEEVVAKDEKEEVALGDVLYAPPGTSHHLQ